MTKINIIYDLNATTFAYKTYLINSESGLSVCEFGRKKIYDAFLYASYCSIYYIPLSNKFESYTYLKALNRKNK